jgi:hypothetical protein
MSTLKPTPSFNKNVPVVTPGGGSSLAYKDPNSPESILRNTATLQAQALVDTKYDVNTTGYHEGFKLNLRRRHRPYKNSYILVILLTLFLFFIVYKSKKIVLSTGLIILLVLFLEYYYFLKFENAVALTFKDHTEENGRTNIQYP